MKQKIYLLTDDLELRNSFCQIAAPVVEIDTELNESEIDSLRDGSLVFLDQNWKKRKSYVSKLKARSNFVVLVVSHSNGHLPEDLVSGAIDDVLLTPLRSLDVLCKIRHFLNLAQILDVRDINASVTAMLEKVEGDLKIARSIQEKFIPQKFGPISDIKINHKYLSGLKSGGDYLDVFEFEDGVHVGVLMSDSSGYGLSSAFMTVMLRTAFRYTRGEVQSPAATMRRICNDLKFVMKAKEDFSLFFGILNRRTLEMNYASCGNVRFIRNGHQENQVSVPLKREEAFQGTDTTVSLTPGDRLVFMTDGFYSAYERSDSFKDAFDRLKKKDPTDLINECIYQVKRRFQSDDDMPEQDCSIIVMDLERATLRLAKA